ncbi:hypothetical protein ACJJTC_007627 [Scirpophaga incertulas]
MPVARALRSFCNRSVVPSCYRKISEMQTRYSATSGFKPYIFNPYSVSTRNLGLGPTSKDFEEPLQMTGPITRAHATELVLHMNDEERKLLLTALQEYESNRVKEAFEDKLAGLRWRSKFGRPSKVPSLGDVDPTGTYCPVPEDWLKKKYASTVPKPNTRELLHLSLANAIPFIGFECPQGDSIESSLSVYVTLSTMAAAALGNTFSDVIGIGSSHYVERAAAFIGLKAPALSPVQLDMPVSRRFTNMGRVVGITLGCFLGMIPLLFIDDEKKESPSGKSEKAKQPGAADQLEPPKEPSILPQKPAK